MAAEAATFSPHLADSLLEAHVRPVLLPALSSGARRRMYRSMAIDGDGCRW